MVKFLARWIARHPVWVLVGLGAITVFFGIFVPKLEFLSDMEKMLPQDDPVVQRFEETKDTFGSQSVVMIAMAAPEEETVFNLQSLKKLYALTEELELLEDEGLLEDVISPANVETVQGTDVSLIVGPVLPGPPTTEDDVETFREKILEERQLVGSLVLADGSAAAIILKVHPDAEGDQFKIADIMERVNTAIARYQGPETFYVTGDAPLIYYADLYMHRDLAFLFPIVVLVVLAVLFVSFRSLRGMILPLAVVLLAVTWTVGLMTLCGVPLTIASTFLPVLLVAVGSAYGIHVVNDYFERAVQGKGTREEVIVQVVEEMANPVFTAALTTAIGFLTLLSAFLDPIREFGLFSAAGVIFSFVISLTLIPAILSLTPMPQAIQRRKEKASPLEWGARLLSHILDRRGWVVLAIALILLGGFLAQIPRLQVETDVSKYFRQDSPVIQGMNYVEEHFGGSLQMSVVVDTGQRDGLKDPQVLRFMDDLQAYMGSLEPIGKTSSLVDLVKETNYALHGDDDTYYAIPDSARAIAQVLLLFEMGGGEVLESIVSKDFSRAQITVPVRSVGTAELQDLLQSIQSFIEENRPPGVTAYTTGMPDIYVQISGKIVHSQITTLVTSLCGVGIVVSLLMGSFIAGLLSLTPLVLSVVGNFGTMALTGANLDIATVMIASIIIGIGVDYSVHFITRYRRERRRGAPHKEALFVTYNTTGRAIIYNALTLTFGFLVLTLSHFGALQTLGWLVALTMVASALGALLIVPATLGFSHPKFLTRQVAVIRKGGFGLIRKTDKRNLMDLPEKNRDKNQKEAADAETL
ncbi:RND family transporter [Candidatus Bipolaricaulota bacterium]|nr:RND family transporter [Candidatus Bipolaricaulota bacterium]